MVATRAKKKNEKRPAKKASQAKTKPKKGKRPLSATTLPNNLNAKFTPSIQAQRRTPVSFDNVSNVTVLLDNIEANLCQLIANPSIRYVLATAPWCSSKALFKALAGKEGVGLITQPDKHCRSTTRQQAYAALKPLRPGMDRVRGLRLGRGRATSIIHSKLLVFLDQDRQAVGCATGSWNFSGPNGSSSNIEQVLVLRDPRLASTMRDEWHRIYDISKRLFH